MKKYLIAFLAALTIAMPTSAHDHQSDDITVAVFSLNDFHGAFVRNDYKDIPGAAAIWQTLDSLKHVYPHNLTVSGGDIFGGSYFYNATHGSLLPTFFNDLGIRLSALGNHEFDDGQTSLMRKWADVPQRPSGWDITYVCANVRDSSGAIPAFAQPFASVDIPVDEKRTVRLGFVGLLTSATPQQVSKGRVEGLTFDGNYAAVLDSVKHLAGYATNIKQANIRLLITHIGTVMECDEPEWDDIAAEHLYEISGKTWHGIISAHSHKPVLGKINAAAYPVVQGKWHGEYIATMKFHLDRRTLRVKRVETELVPVRSSIALSAGPARLQAQIDSTLQNTKTLGGTPLGEQLTYTPRTLVHDRDNKYCQTEVGTLVCRSYAEAYRQCAGLPQSAIVVGASHFGSIRAGFVKGSISVLDVGEALPFSNALRAFKLTGRQLFDLVEFGFHNVRYGWLQTAWLDVERNADGHVTALTYVAPDGSRQAIADSTSCVLVADEFIVNGGDGYAPTFFPVAQEIKVDGLPATTDAFINYLKTFKTLPIQ